MRSAPGSVRSAAHVGKVGGLALGYFLVMSTVALTIGLVVGNLLHPGSGLHLTAEVSKAGAAQAGEARRLADAAAANAATLRLASADAQIALNVARSRALAHPGNAVLQRRLGAAELAYQAAAAAAKAAQDAADQAEGAAKVAEDAANASH